MAKRPSRRIKGGTKKIVRKSSQIITQLEKLLELEPYLSDVGDIVESIKRLEPSAREKLLQICEQAFQEENFRKHEPTCIACAKVFIALVPESIGSIKKWVKKSSGKSIHEVHFSIFCFLDNILHLPNNQGFAREIPSLVEEYLTNIKSNTARAAFMAGDLLGDHWEMNEALPVLIRIAKKAKYSAGRDSALHGLGHIMSQLSNFDSDKKLILQLLRNIAQHDRSKIVRFTAELLLEGKTL